MRAEWFEVAVRELIAHDPLCPYSPEAARTLPIDLEYIKETWHGQGIAAALAAVAPIIAAQERERIAKFVDLRGCHANPCCDDISNMVAAIRALGDEPEKKDQ